jgi:hypothetical protein
VFALADFCKLAGSKLLDYIVVGHRALAICSSSQVVLVPNMSLSFGLSTCFQNK